MDGPDCERGNNTNRGMPYLCATPSSGVQKHPILSRPAWHTYALWLPSTSQGELNNNYVSIFPLPFPSPDPLFVPCHQRKKKKKMKQKAMKPPMMMPSRRLRAEILPMRELRPGTWLAAVVMRRLIEARVSRWAAKLSLVA